MYLQISDEEDDVKDAEIPEIEIEQPIVENVIIHFNTQDDNGLDTKPIIERVDENDIPEGIETFPGHLVQQEDMEQVVDEPGTSNDEKCTTNACFEEYSEYKVVLAVSDDNSDEKDEGGRRFTEPTSDTGVMEENQESSEGKFETRKTRNKSKAHVRKNEGKQSAEASIVKEGSTTSDNKITDSKGLMPCQAYGLFRNIHACVKKLQPLRNYTWLCEIDEMKGKSDWDQTYHNYKQGKHFMKCIAKRVRTNIAKELKKASYFSVIVDNERSEFDQDQYSVRVRVVKRAVIQEFFASLKTIKNCSDAQEIWGTIWQCLENVGVTRQMMCRMSSLSLDGACVETDNHGTVVEHAQKMNSCLIGVHCTSHRLEQSLWNAGKQLPLFKKVYILLNGLYDFYTNYTRQRLLLQEAAESVNMDFIPPAQVSSSSWIKTWARALKVMQEGHAAFSKQLSEVPLQQGKLSK